MNSLFLAESQMNKVYNSLFIYVSEDKQYTCGNRKNDGDKVLTRFYLCADKGRSKHSRKACKSYDDEEQNRLDRRESGDIHKDILGNAGDKE